jgi:hypothetical protein
VNCTIKLPLYGIVLIVSFPVSRHHPGRWVAG